MTYHSRYDSLNLHVKAPRFTLPDARRYLSCPFSPIILLMKHFSVWFLLYRKEESSETFRTALSHVQVTCVNGILSLRATLFTLFNSCHRHSIMLLELQEREYLRLAK